MPVFCVGNGNQAQMVTRAHTQNNKSIWTWERQHSRNTCTDSTKEMSSGAHGMQAVCSDMGQEWVACTQYGEVSGAGVGA